MLSNEGFTLALKGRRKGLDVRWEELLSGEADFLGNHRIVLARLHAVFTRGLVGCGPMRSDAQPRDGCPFQFTIRGYESFVPDAI